MLAKNIKVGDRLRATCDKNKGRIKQGEILTVLEIDKTENKAQIYVEWWRGRLMTWLWTSTLNLEKVTE